MAEEEQVQPKAEGQAEAVAEGAERAAEEAPEKESEEADGEAEEGPGGPHDDAQEGAVEKQDLDELPDLDMKKCGLPSADTLFALGEEALDTTTQVNNGIVKSIEGFPRKVRTQNVDFGPAGGEPQGAIGELKAFVSLFVRVCGEMLPDVTACVPQIDLGMIEEGKLKIVWPTFNCDKLSVELRSKAEKAWEWVKSMLTEIKDLTCDGFAEVPAIVENFTAGCKQLSLSKLLGGGQAELQWPLRSRPAGQGRASPPTSRWPRTTS
ncbi:unnamed protein product [Prorocentrum cordatum]|uniref:Uncharacterized protein n=1 Tax=Prorocentrum cordatum TaxID=2364126 RepID=A0ABN9YGF2_9DINO|nr:unnamed protein product [Polarella glacialis]